jgi:hypothetical protein
MRINTAMPLAIIAAVVALSGCPSYGETVGEPELNQFWDSYYDYLAANPREMVDSKALEYAATHTRLGNDLCPDYDTWKKRLKQCAEAPVADGGNPNVYTLSDRVREQREIWWAQRMNLRGTAGETDPREQRGAVERMDRDDREAERTRNHARSGTPGHSDLHHMDAEPTADGENIRNAIGD